MSKFKVGDKVYIKYDDSVGFVVRIPEGTETRYLVRHKDSQGRFPQDYFDEFELDSPGLFGAKKGKVKE